jgi:hypothetical protein
VLAEAVDLAFGDRSIWWRAPLLALASATGVGIIVTLAYAFAVQDHVAQGGDEYPDVDVDYLFYGFKFFVAILIFLVPGYALFGGLGLPALLDVASAGIEGTSTAVAWDAAGGRWALFLALAAALAAFLGVVLPASMACFLDGNGRLASALDPVRASRFIRRAGRPYRQLAAVLAVWASVEIAIYVPLELLTPTGSTLPLLAAFFVMLPISMVVLMLVQVMLGLMRRDMTNESLHGWDHLARHAGLSAAAHTEETAETEAPAEPAETPGSPEATRSASSEARGPDDA